MGQLRMIIQSEFDADVVGFSKVKGKPFQVSEVIEKNPIPLLIITKYNYEQH